LPSDLRVLKGGYFIANMRMLAKQVFEVCIRQEAGNKSIRRRSRSNLGL
jgi:hypothetical protein